MPGVLTARDLPIFRDPCSFSTMYVVRIFARCCVCAPCYVIPNSNYLFQINESIILLVEHQIIIVFVTDVFLSVKCVTNSVSQCCQFSSEFPGLRNPVFSPIMGLNLHFTIFLNGFSYTIKRKVSFIAVYFINAFI